MNGRIIHAITNSVTGVISNLRQGDYVFLDLDETLILGGMGDGAILSEKELVKQIKILQESNIRVIGLTARVQGLTEVTRAQLKKNGIEFEEVIHAPSIHSDATKIVQKGRVLKEYIDQLPVTAKPKRILMVDDNVDQLDDIAKEMKDVGIPMMLYHYQRQTHQVINESKESKKFPDDLSGFTEATSLGGGTNSTYLIRNPHTKERFVIKYGANREAIQLEILCNAIYKVLGVPVPGMHLYKSLPSALAIKIGVKSTEGIFQVSEYIEQANQDQEISIKSARAHFIAHALIGNIDVAKTDNFIGDILIDAGANLKKRSLGEARNEEASVLTELSSLRDESKNHTAYEWFGSLTDGTLVEQAAAILEKSSEIEKVIWEVSAHLDMSEQLRDEFLSHMADRLDILATQFCIAMRPVARDAKKADADKTAAGVLSYKLIDNEPYILLSKRVRHEWWDNLGGKSDGQDKIIAETAIREVAEESNNELHYQLHDLRRNPSHDLVTYRDGKPFTYRMYLMEDTDADIDNLNDDEHTDHCYVPLTALLHEITNNNQVICEGERTIKLIDSDTEKEIIIYPPLYQMLLQQPVLENLTRLSCGEKLLNRHTQGELVNTKKIPVKPLHHPLESVEERKQQLNDVLINHVKVMQVLKKRSKNKPRHNHIVVQERMSQSELHLKSILGKDYLPNCLRKNISYFFEKYHPFSSSISLAQRKRLIDQCVYFIEAEKTTADKYVYFYHGCDAKTAFAYTVYTMLYESLKVSDSWPVFRAVNKYFERFETIQQFIAHYSNNEREPINNYAGGYPQCAISANVFLLGNYTNFASCSIDYYINNSVQSDMDLEAFFQELFQPFSVPQNVIKRLLVIYEDYAKRQQGSLYQLRVPSRQVSEYAYPAVSGGPMNELNGERNLSVILSTLKAEILKEINGEISAYIQSLQARVFVRPDMKFEVKHIVWHKPSTANEKNENEQYQKQMQKTIQMILYSILNNMNIYDNTIHQSQPAFRLLSILYQQQGILFSAPKISSYMVAEAILKDDILKVKQMLSQYPEMKFASVSHPKVVEGKTVFQLMLSRSKSFVEALLESCYDDDWWQHIDVQTGNEMIEMLPIVPQDQQCNFIRHYRHILEKMPADIVYKLLHHLPESERLVCCELLNDELLIALLFHIIVKHDSDFLMTLLTKFNLHPDEVKNGINGYPLLTAAVYSDVKMVKCLLGVPNINLNVVDIAGMTPLMHVSRSDRYDKVIDILLSCLQIDFNKTCDHGNTALWYAVSNYNAVAVDKLLQIPTIIPNYIQRADKVTPLHIAAENGNSYCVQRLVTFPGIDPQPLTADGDTPLLLAIKAKRYNAAKILLTADGINPNFTGNGYTPLWVTASSICNNVDFITALLQMPGIDINKTCDGLTPLAIACRSHNIEMIIALLAMHDIDVYKTDVLSEAMKSRNHVALQLILSYMKKDVLKSPALFHNIISQVGIDAMIAVLTVDELTQLLCMSEANQYMKAIDFNKLILILYALVPEKRLACITHFTHVIQHGYQLVALCELLQKDDLFTFAASHLKQIDSVYRLTQIANRAPFYKREELVMLCVDIIRNIDDLEMVSQFLSEANYQALFSKVVGVNSQNPTIKIENKFSLFSSPINKAFFVGGSEALKTIADKFDFWMMHYVQSHATNNDYSDHKNCMVKWLSQDGGNQLVTTYPQFCRLASELTALGYDTNPPPSKEAFEGGMKMCQQRQRFYS